MTNTGAISHIPDDLVRWEPSADPVVSCYVDWRVSGRGLHEAPTVVRKQLHDAASTLRDEPRASLDADAARIQQYLAEEADPAARGLVMFACSGRGLWRAAALGVPVETEIHVGERPRLLPLIEATQDAARTLVALTDSQQVRLIELDLAGAHEEAGPHRRNAETSRHVAAGGWSQANFQRSRDLAVERFAHEAAAAITEAVDKRGVAQIVIGGDAVISGPLLDALPAHVIERVSAVEHVDILAPIEEVAQRVWPAAAEVVAMRRDEAVRELASRADGGIHATSEPSEVRELVAAGRIDTLALDPARMDAEAAELLAREALAHRSRLVIARDSEALAGAGGMAARLR